MNILNVEPKDFSNDAKSLYINELRGGGVQRMLLE